MDKREDFPVVIVWLIGALLISLVWAWFSG
jgi:hypothetical protein